MAGVPSVGDILMLSQLAWRIGRAFTQGRRSALAEFTEVEREANGLSESLKLVAETLYSDNNILSQADSNTRSAVSTILESAHRTLSDLESFVERYRVIKKKETNGGFVVERAWSEVVIANYKTLKWTTEGGDINELRNILNMHTKTLSLTIKAMQSRSLTKLEHTVLPMAEEVAAIHEAVNGDLSVKMDDLQRVLSSIANSTPAMGADDQTDRGRQSSVTSESNESYAEAASPISTRSKNSLREGAPRIPQRNPSRMSDRTRVSPHASVSSRGMRGDSAYFSMGPAPPDHDGKRMDWGFESGSPPPDRNSIGAMTSIPPSGTTAAMTPGSAFVLDADEQHFHARRESLTVPHLFSTFDDDAHFDAEPEYTPATTIYEQSSPEMSSPSRSYKKEAYFPPRQNLPPPALAADNYNTQQPATPASIFKTRPIKRVESNFSVHAGAPPDPRPMTAKSIKRESERTPALVISDAGQKFEKALFRNAAILCDVRGTLVEYAQHLPDEPDPRYNTEMVAACKACRIFVIRKRENQPHGGFKVISSIWAISDDGKVRAQQRLSDLFETVPYCSYFQPEKVSLPPTEGSEMTIRFHAEKWGDDIQKEAHSNWINYIFETEDAAIAFQSAIFGRTLLGSFRTTKTTVIHDGLKGAFAFEEQFANIEVLRLWEDDGITTVGAGGGVLALMHLGSNFGEGWARWWMNSSKQHVRVKDEMNKFARIKGIDVRTVKPGERARQASISAGDDIAAASKKRSPEKRVTGVRIEFKNEEERAKFVELARRVQERMLPLPDV